MAPLNYEKLYDAYYFQHGCGEPYERSPARLEFFAGIADRLARELGPRTVLDAGCAMGLLVEGFRALGVRAFGVDVSEYALRHVRPDLKPYCWLASLAAPLPGRFDLAICIEVVEHLPPPQGDLAVKHICQVSNDVIFSSSPLDYREATHFNVQPPEYWAERFAAHGFVRDLDFDLSFITPWAARFCKTDEALARVVRAYERHLWLARHANAEMRQQALETRKQLAALEQSLRDCEACAAQPPTAAVEAKVRALSAELDEIHNSQAWRLAQWIWRIRRRFMPVERSPGTGAVPRKRG